MCLRFVRSTYRALDKPGSKEMKLLVVTLHHITAPGRHRIVSKSAVHCSSAENVRPWRWWQVLGRVDCGPAGEDRLCTDRREIHHLRKTPLLCGAPIVCPEAILANDRLSTETSVFMHL
jgi:hypothetical protein